MANYIPAPKVGFGGKILPICLISSCLWICVICYGFSKKKIWASSSTIKKAVHGSMSWNSKTVIRWKNNEQRYVRSLWRWNFEYPCRRNHHEGWKDFDGWQWQRLSLLRWRQGEIRWNSRRGCRPWGVGGNRRSDGNWPPWLCAWKLFLWRHAFQSEQADLWDFAFLLYESAWCFCADQWKLYGG